MAITSSWWSSLFTPRALRRSTTRATECGTVRTLDYICKRLMSSKAEVTMALDILKGRLAVRQIGDGYTAL